MNHARANTVPFRLIEGGLINCSREFLVGRMVADVVREGTAGDEDAAMQTLRRNGYGWPDILMCIDNVRQAAFQQTVDVVSAEMARVEA